MNSINEIAENLIRGAKSGLSEMSFVKAYRGSPARIPLDGFLAVVSVGAVSRRKCFIGGVCSNGLKGDLYSADMRVTLHAPCSAGGEALSLKALELSDELRDADSEGYIQDISISGIAYDNKNLSVYRDVVASISYLLCEVENE